MNEENEQLKQQVLKLMEIVANEEVMYKVAEVYWNLYQGLIKVGFSAEQALDIAKGYRFDYSKRA